HPDNREGRAGRCPAPPENSEWRFFFRFAPNRRTQALFETSGGCKPERLIFHRQSQPPNLLLGPRARLAFLQLRFDFHAVDELQLAIRKLVKQPTCFLTSQP